MRVEPELDINKLFDYACAHYNAGQFDKAEEFCLRILEELPKEVRVLHMLGVILYHNKQHEDAIKYLKLACKFGDPDSAIFYNIGRLYHDIGDIRNALLYYEKATALDPDYVTPCKNTGIIYARRGNLEKAKENFDKYYSVNEDDSDAEYHITMGLLKIGKLKEGFERYEIRKKVRPDKHDRKDLIYPDWNGDSLTNKTIFIYAEQGIGEDYMYANMIPDIIKNCKQCIIEVEKRQVATFARSFPEAKVIERGSKIEQAIDCKSAFGSIARFFRTDLNDFPKHDGYLKADQQRVAELKKKYGNKINIGISWFTKSVNVGQQNRNIPLKDWEEILSLEGFSFINLQYGDHDLEIKRLEKEAGLIVHNDHEIDPLKNLNDFAAKVDAMDIVLTIDNATAHLAGALGKETIVMLPYSSAYNWLSNTSDTPWYPSVTLIHQTIEGEWDGVINEVVNRLKAR